MLGADDDPLEHLTDDEIAQVLVLYQAGCCAEEIADTMHIERQDVLCALEIDDALFPDEPLDRVLH